MYLKTKLFSLLLLLQIFKQLLFSNKNKNSINSSISSSFGKCGTSFLPKKKIVNIKSNISQIEQLSSTLNNYKDNSKIKKKLLTEANSSEFKNLRILIDTTKIKKYETQYLYPENLLDYILSLLPETISLISSIFLLKTKFSSKLKLTEDLITSPEKCGIDEYDPNILNQEGIDTDLLIFPIFDGTLYSNGALAAASICVSIDGRPVVGIMHFKPSFNYTKSGADVYFKQILFHEISHLLGFHPDIYEKFITESEDKSTLYISSPLVIKAAKKHFGCDSIKGVRLENQGTGGTLGAHWETRIMHTDYMCGTLGEFAISEITLALFEDLGWYKVRFFTGGLFKYGKQKGCNF